MRQQFREQLSELAERLHLHDGDGSDRARELSGRLTEAVDADEDDDEGLGEWLNEQVVEFENEHPELAAVIRRAADALGAAGL